MTMVLVRTLVTLFDATGNFFGLAGNFSGLFMRQT